MRAWALAALLLTNCYMPPNVEQILVPLGLITQPNKLGQYPAGALSQASGLALRSAGLLTRMPLLESYYASPYIQAAPLVPHLLGAADSMLFALGRKTSNGHWELVFFTGPATKFGNDLQAAGLPFQPITFDSTGRTAWTQQRGRYLFNSDQGILVTDTGTPTSNATALPRHAGILPPNLSPTSLSSGVVGVIAAGNIAAYTCLIRRKFSDGYEIVSPPSAAVSSGDNVVSDTTLTTNWLANNAYLAGDIVEFYRTPQQVLGTNVGSTYYLCQTYTLTNADIAARQIVTAPIDRCVETGLGAELYTNPGQGGPNNFKQSPPLARAMATFKGYTFYGNRTDIASYGINIPLGLVVSKQASSAPPTPDPFVRKNGIGTRYFDATFTNTSNVLTAIPLADMVGLAVGQLVSDVALSGSGIATVTAVGANTLTLSLTATANVTKTTFTYDVLAVNGIPFGINTWSSFAQSLQQTGTGVTALGLLAPALVPVPNPTGNVFNDRYSARSFAITGGYAGNPSFTLAASNPQNYVPPLPSTVATALTVSAKQVANGLAWSEQGQPEAVPPLNTLSVGSGTIYGMWATRDSLWIFTSDGLWQLTGTGGAAGRGFDWSIINRDSTLSLSAPHAACVLKDSVYAYTNRGLIAVSSSGLKENLSQGRLNDLLPGPPFSLTRDIQVWADETNDEIWLAVNATTSPVIYVFNTLSDAWTTHPGDSGSTPLQGTYARFLQAIVTIDQNNAYSPNQVTASFAPLTLDYQPVSDGDALTLRQWIDEVWVFDTATATFLSGGVPVSPTPRWNGIDYAAQAHAAKSQSQDSRLSFSIPRNAPAVANTLAPGLKVASTVYPMSIYGIALRSVPLTSQRKQR